MSEEITNPNVFQQIQEATNDVATVGNTIDVAALYGAWWSAPRFDTAAGIAVGLVSFGADGVDGWVSRKLGTVSELGAKLDTGGDKAKLFWGMYNIWKNGQATKPLLLSVAAHNAANTAITLADRRYNKVPQVEVSDNGKKAMRWQVLGLGLSVIGTKVGERSQSLGKAARLGGTVMGIYGTIRYGLPATKGYLDAYYAGEKREVLPLLEP